MQTEKNKTLYQVIMNNTVFIYIFPNLAPSLPRPEKKKKKTIKSKTMNSIMKDNAILYKIKKGEKP